MYESRKKCGAVVMEMTSRQFQGFIRLTLMQIGRALEISPDNKELIELRNIYQSMLEDE